MAEEPKEPAPPPLGPFDDDDRKTLHEVAINYRFRQRLKARAWFFAKWIAAVGAALTVAKEWLVDLISRGGQ